MSTFNCCKCQQEKPVSTDGGTGYAIHNEGGQVGKICYQCCGEIDKAHLLSTGKLTGYLVQERGRWRFTNWPASLVLTVQSFRKSWHNFAGHDGRTDFWLTFEGHTYHGVQIGHNSQLATIKKVKA